jgi:hypothetical protein
MPEGEIATKFKVRAAEDLYKELNEAGYPICALCGAHPVGDGHCPKPPRAPANLPARKARRKSGGESIELPPAANAIPAFERVLRTLQGDIEYMRHHREALEGGRFLATGAVEAEGGLSPTVRCAGPYPHKYLVRLIGVHLLCVDSWADVENLLNQLHPDPTEADKKRIYRLLSGETASEKRADALRPIARQLARLIRGGTKKGPGRNAEGMSLFEHMVGDSLKAAQEDGTEAETKQMWLEEGVLEAELERLGKIFGGPP